MAPSRSWGRLRGSSRTARCWASIPLGGIILWSGSPSAIPSGWSICNGANGTPNLAGTIIQAVAPGSAVNGASTIIANVNTSSTTVTFNVWELYYIMRLA